MTRLAAAAVLLQATAVLAATPVSATPATHETWPEQYDGSEHFAAGEHPCVPWAGTFSETRSGSYRLLTTPGRRDGELHVNGVVSGTVRLVPDDPALATYDGSYREKVNAVVLEVTDEGDVSRVAQYRLRSVLEGSDGSALTLVLAGKVTTRPDGQVVVSRDVLTCA